MKKIILIICFLSLFNVICAENEAFKIGENRASFGLGLGWIHKEAFKKSVHLPAPNAVIERGAVPFKDLGFLSIGAEFGFHYGFHKDKIPVTNLNYKESWAEIYFLPRVALYCHELFYEDDFPTNIDLYGGIGLGIIYLSDQFSPNISNLVGLDDNSGFKLGYNIFVGARYYFKPNTAVYAELGYGLSFLNFGISVKY